MYFLLTKHHLLFQIQFVARVFANLEWEEAINADEWGHRQLTPGNNIFSASSLKASLGSSELYIRQVHYTGRTVYQLAAGASSTHKPTLALLAALAPVKGCLATHEAALNHTSNPGRLTAKCTNELTPAQISLIQYNVICGKPRSAP